MSRRVDKSIAGGDDTSIARADDASIAYRTVTAAAVMIAVLAAVLQRAVGPAAGLLVIAGIPAGFVFSYHRRGKRNVVLKIVLACALLIAFAAFLGQVRGASNVDDTRGPLVGIFLWVQMLHSFDVPRSRDLGFSLASSVVLVALAGSLAFSSGFLLFVVVFAVAFIAALVLAHRDELRRVDGDVAREVSASGASPAEEARRPGPALRRLGLLGGVTVLATSLVFVFMPRLPAAQVASLPFSITPAQPIPGFVGGVATPPSRAAGGGSSDGLDTQTYVGFGNGIDLRARGTLSRELVMRVRTPRPTLYRAQAYDTYRSASWTSGDKQLDELTGDGVNPISVPAPADERAGGDEVMQTFYVERDLPNVVFHAYRAREVYIASTRLRVDDFSSVRTPYLLEKDTIYSVVSSVPDADPNALRSAGATRPDDASLARYLEVPATLTGRFAKLANTITAPHAATVDKVRAVESWLARNKRYRIDISPDPPGRDPVDVFVFDRREGFCEQIASTMALMLRASGVPTRLVTGFGPGERNIFTGYWEIRNADAHAWVEVLYPGFGWIPYDPTFGVPTAGAGDTTFMFAPLRKLTEVFGSGALGGVTRAARTVTGALPGPGWLSLPLVVALALAGFALARSVRRRRGPGREPPDPAVDAWLELERALEGEGLKRPAHETTLEFAGRLTPLRNRLGTDVVELAVRFGELRYGERGDADLVGFDADVRQAARRIRSGSSVS